MKLLSIPRRRTAAPSALPVTTAPAMLPSLIVLASLFLCGVAAGSLTAAHVDGEAGNTLVSYLREYLSVLGARPDIGSVIGRAFFNAFKYHLVVMLLGLTLPGVVLIPGTMAFRGFFLSFAVTAFVRVYGIGGLWFALGAFGVQTLLTLPCLFALAQSGLQTSLTLLGSVRGKKPAAKVVTSAYFFRFIVFALVLALSALFEAFVSPSLLAFVSEQIIG